MYDPHRVHSGTDLQGTEAEGRCRSEDGREDRQHVDELAEPSFGPTDADQRDERRAEQLLASQAEGPVGDGQTHDGVDRPGVQTPVEDRGGEGVRDILRPLARDAVTVVVQRISGTVEHQADTHAGREHHRDPAGGVELGFLVVLTELDPSVLAQSEKEDEPDEDGAGDDVHPAEIRDDEVEGRSCEV